MSLVVDSSVAIKWFVRETLYREADALLAAESELFAPSLLVYEVANVFWKKWRLGEVTADQADHPAYDCFYVACARLLGCPLVTADTRLHRVLQATEYAASVRHLADA